MAKLLIFCALLSTWSNPAVAEEAEATVGVAGSGMLPSFESPEPTAFALAAWSAGVFGHYGLTPSLSIGGAFDLAQFTGEAQSRPIHTDTFSGTANVNFHGYFYHPQLFAKYKLYRGYDWAPSIQIGVGYLWARYMDPIAVNGSGANLGLNLHSFAEGTPTVSVALMGDMRLFHFVTAGIGVSYTRMLRGMLEQSIGLPAHVGVYW